MADYRLRMDKHGIVPLDAHARINRWTAMRVCLIYGRWASQIHGPFDIAGLYKTAGLTGSESSFWNTARGLAELGHEVAAFCDCEAATETTDGVPVFPLNMLEDGAGLALIAPEVVLAWNEPDLLRMASAGSLRVVAQQLNDWSYCQPGFTEHVDLYVFPSEHHRQYHANHHMHEADAKGAVIPNSVNLEMFDPGDDCCDVCQNGTLKEYCDGSQYKDGDSFGSQFKNGCPACGRKYRFPHRVIWCSSPDRGLHHLLSFWPEVRARVPDAKLDIYYRVRVWLDHMRTNIFPTVIENARRARYVEEALLRLGADDPAHPWGVRLHDCVSNQQMADELRRAAVLAYSCSPIRYTEGYGVSVLDACAAGCVPIISDADALPSVHGAAADVIPGEPGDMRRMWVETIVTRLTAPAEPQRIATMRAHAEAHSRKMVASQWETLLEGKVYARHT